MTWSGRLKKALLGEERGQPATSVELDRASPPAASHRADATTGQDILADLKSTLVALSEGKLSTEQIDPAAHLFDYGYIDSLTAVNLLGHIETRYGVAISDVELAGRLSCLQALADHVREESGAGSPQ